MFAVRNIKLGISSKSEDKNPKRIQIFLYTMCIIGNCVVVIVYWTAIHHVTIPQHRADGPYTKVLCQYFVHIVPAVICVINSSITNCVLSRRGLHSCMLIGTVYFTINFLAVKFLNDGVPLYAFLHWRSWHSPVLCVTLLLGFAVFYLVLVLVDESFKHKLVAARNKKIGELLFKNSRSNEQVIFNEPLKRRLLLCDRIFNKLNSKDGTITYKGMEEYIVSANLDQ